MSITYSHPEQLELFDIVDSTMAGNLSIYSTMNTSNINLTSSYAWPTSGTLSSNITSVGGTITASNAFSVLGDADFNGNLTVKGTNITLLLERVQVSLEKMEQRLNILTIDPSLEERWEKLREIGEKYRTLEQEILEAEKTWKILKS
jgi:hypothetical protein